MAHLTDADLASTQVDLADVPLDVLRGRATSELVAALEGILARAEYDTGNEIQDQRQT